MVSGKIAIKSMIVGSFLLCCTAWAQTQASQPPSKESVQKLVGLLHVEKVLEAVHAQTEASMKAALQQALQGQLSPEEQHAVDRFRIRSTAITNEWLTMEHFMPMYIQIYEENLSQQEVDGLIAFYSSPTGKAFVEKLPAISQAILAKTSVMMAPMMEKLREAGDDMKTELEALQLR
jgi:hypothetical protein